MRDGRSLRLGVVTAALVAAVLAFPSAAAAIPTTTNVGLASSNSFGSVALDGGRLAFDVSESYQGGVDRNGDGDAIDDVVAVWDPATNTTTNLGLTAVWWSRMVALDGGRLAFEVCEACQGGVDRNGDGDASDYVLAVWDPATNTTTNLGLAIFSYYHGIFALGGGRLAFHVSEYGQGGVDRNGDGDASDMVLAVWDPATNTTTNLGLATEGGGPLFALGGGRLAFHVSEPYQGGLDRNGDGDASDHVVVAVWDPATNTTTNLGLASYAFNLSVALDGGRLAFDVSESYQGGVDRNGDGDASDVVFAVWDPATNTTTNLGLGHAYFSRFVALDGGRLAFAVSEFSQGGLDRNGDGDASDDVVAVWDPATNTTTNLGLTSYSYDFFVALDGGRLAFKVYEPYQGGLDRNGDGDAFDLVAAVWDPATNTTTNLGLALFFNYAFVALDGGRLGFGVPEFSQGGLDRNGDGDASDEMVVAVWDPATNTTTNLGLASYYYPVALDGGRLAFEVPESYQGGVDRNGDGDAIDLVPAIWDPATNTTTNLALAAVDTFSFRFVALDEGRLAFAVYEYGQGGVDRNGDGDASDEVVAVYNTADVTAPATLIALAPATTDGQNGWYVSGVTVTVAATDDAGGSGVAETRCVLDPASTPATFDDIPAGCAYKGAGASVLADGEHTVYASSKDAAGNVETPVLVSFKIDQTDPTVTCDVASPGPIFLLLGSGGNVSATVTDATSGPAPGSESAAANVATVGNKTVSLTGEDNAGNWTTVSCPYRVNYRFLGFQNLKSSYKQNQTIPVKFMLANAAGTAIPDADAQALLTPCRVKVTLDAVEQTGCASYDAATDTFQYNLKTSKSLAVGPHGLAIIVSAPDGSGVVNTNGTTITITK